MFTMCLLSIQTLNRYRRNRFLTVQNLMDKHRVCVLFYVSNRNFLVVSRIHTARECFFIQKTEIIII